MLHVGSSDEDINVLELNTTSDTVKDVLQFVYTGTTNIHIGNAELLLTQSMELELHGLTQQCIGFIEENLSIDNVIQYYACSVDLSCDPLSMITSEYIRHNYTEVLQTKNITKLQIGHLESLLESMDRATDEEHRKLDVVLQWFAEHSDCSECAALISAIKFNELSIEYLISVIDSPLLEQPHKLSMQVALNMKYEQQLEMQGGVIQKEREALRRDQENMQKERGTLRRDRQNIECEKQTLRRDQQNIQREQETLRRDQKSIQYKDQTLQRERESLKNTLRYERFFLSIFVCLSFSFGIYYFVY